MLDLRMPKKDGLQVLTELMSRRVPEPRIIVMTAYESEEDLRRALNAGAKGYLVKGANPQQIRAAIRTVAAGQSLLPSEIVKLAESPAHSKLLERELQVLQIYCEWQKQHGDRTNSRYQRRYSKGSHKVYTHKVGPWAVQKPLPSLPSAGLSKRVIFRTLSHIVLRYPEVFRSFWW